MRISVIIPTFNRKNVLKRTLPTLFEQVLPRTEYEVIVAVDGSTDGTGAFLHQLSPPVKLQIIIEANRGPAAARNSGLKVARGELVLLLDDDLLCDRGLLLAHIRAHEATSSDVVFGPVRTSDQSPERLTASCIHGEVDEYYDTLDRGRELRWPEDVWVPPNCSIPRRLLVSLGGFDERFGAGREDTELGIRLWQAGVKFRYVGAASTHQLYVKTPEQFVNAAEATGRGDFLLVQKYPFYRKYSRLTVLQTGGRFRRALRQAVVRMPFGPDLFLGLLFLGAEPWLRMSVVRRFARRLLHMRRAVIWYRSALRQAGNWRSLNELLTGYNES